MRKKCKIKKGITTIIRGNLVHPTVCIFFSLGGIVRGESFLFRHGRDGRRSETRSRSGSSSNITISNPQPVLQEHIITLHRDQNGSYGLTLSGDNPVEVQSIKEGEQPEFTHLVTLIN